jgi:hypothetical protein
MGILVPQATLPSGIVLSNVYMTFTGEVLYVNKLQSGLYMIRCFYRVYKDYASRTQQPNIRVEASVNVQDPNNNPFKMLYDALKAQYPGATDVLEPSQVTLPVTLTVSKETLASLKNDLENTPEDGVEIPFTEEALDALKEISSS